MDPHSSAAHPPPPLARPSGVSGCQVIRFCLLHPPALVREGLDTRHHRPLSNRQSNSKEERRSWRPLEKNLNRRKNPDHTKYQTIIFATKIKTLRPCEVFDHDPRTVTPRSPPFSQAGTTHYPFLTLMHHLPPTHRACRWLKFKKKARARVDDPQSPPIWSATPETPTIAVEFLLSV